MLQKFVKITRVGKFSDYSAAGDMQLRRANLVFGENGRGKSTIVAIMRSLQSGDGNHILERLTLNRVGGPEVHLILEPNKQARFHDGKWDCPPVAIEIFDTNFVYENVYVGHVVEHEQKKNLFKVVVGEKGVKLGEKVDKLDNDIRAANTKIAGSKAVVEAKIEGGMKIADFVKLSKVDDIEKQIEEQEQVIASQKSAGEVAARAALTEQDLPSIPDLALLQKTIDEVSAEAEELVAKHIADNLDEHGEEWIAQGYEYLGEEEECPFCGQATDAVKLFAAYKAHFNAAYAELKDNVAALGRSIDTVLGAAALMKAQAVVTMNAAHVEFWKRFITFDAPVLDLDKLKAAWTKLEAACTGHVKRKVAAPLDAIPHDAALKEAIDGFKAVAKDVDAYNEAVKAVNKLITAKKSETAAGNLTAEQQKLTTLKNTKTRHDPAVVKLVDAYEADQKAKKQLDKDKKKVKDNLDLHCNHVFGAYQKELNELLNDFGAEFQIEQGERSFIGGKPSWTYGIRINTKSVPLTSEKGKASLGNTLSIGDRSALALAFFLTKLSHDPDLKDKCVVFDDPVCSLDRFRMECTVNQILKVAAKAKQVFVLCHDPYCLKKIYDRMLPANVKTLTLERHVSDSNMIEWDIEAATRSQYFQDYKTLSDFLQYGTQKRELRDIARKIRPLLEENLRVRFPDEFATGWLGDFITRIRDAKPGEPLEAMKGQLQQLIEINDYSKQYHHGTNEAADHHPISETELKTFTKKTFDFIRGVA